MLCVDLFPQETESKNNFDLVRFLIVRKPKGEWSAKNISRETDNLLIYIHIIINDFYDASPASFEDEMFVKLLAVPRKLTVLFTEAMSAVTKFEKLRQSVVDNSSINNNCFPKSPCSYNQIWSIT